MFENPRRQMSFLDDFVAKILRWIGFDKVWSQATSLRQKSSDSSMISSIKFVGRYFDKWLSSVPGDKSAKSSDSSMISSIGSSQGMVVFHLLGAISINGKSAKPSDSSMISSIKSRGVVVFHLLGAMCEKNCLFFNLFWVFWNTRIQNKFFSE